MNLAVDPTWREARARDCYQRGIGSAVTARVLPPCDLGGERRQGHPIRKPATASRSADLCLYRQ